MSFQKFRVRSIRDAGHLIKAAAISGTNPITLLILDMNEVDHFSLQLIWTGTITGDVKVYCSNSYNPNPTDNQNEAIALNAATWTDTGDRYLEDFTAPAGAAGNSEIHGTYVEAGFLKFVITPASGSGTIDGYASGKSVS